MASQITLLTDFVGGQGVGAANYLTYAADLDSNFSTIQTNFNTLVTEFAAITGPNAALILDFLLLNDADSPLGIIGEGIVGGHSYFVVAGPGDAVTVRAGQGVVAGLRTLNATNAVLDTSGFGTDDLFVNLANTGLLTIQTAPLAVTNSIDIASFSTITGTPTASTIVQLAQIFPDADDLANAADRQADIGSGLTNNLFELFTYRGLSDRFDDIERRLTGVHLTANGQVMPDADAGIGISGTVTVPFLRPATLAGAVDANAGWYRSAADEMSWSDGTNQIFELNTRVGILAGTEALPGLNPLGDPNTGIWFPGGDRVAIVNNGSATAEFSAENHIDSATQPRVATQGTHVNGATTAAGLTAINMDTENVDVGGWFAATSADHTVPSGAAGFYWITATCEFVESTGIANGGDFRHIAITRNGATSVLAGGQGQALQPPQAGGTSDPILSCSAGLVLAAADVIRLSADQNSGSNMDVNATLTIVKLW